MSGASIPDYLAGRKAKKKMNLRKNIITYFLHFKI
jgi:hypothetical protein